MPFVPEPGSMEEAFVMALAELGVKVQWTEEGTWQVAAGTDPTLCWRASNLTAPLGGEPLLSYEEWAAWMVNNAPGGRTEAARLWVYGRTA